MHTPGKVLHWWYTERRLQIKMPTKNPRVNVVLERPLYDTIRRLAKRDRISVSSKVRDLVGRALETEEDIALSAIAEIRERTFNRGRALSHRQVWRKTPLAK
jgi:hypothetical protein